MLKKILILLSICLIAFTACKKQQTTEQTENKTDASSTPAVTETVTAAVVTPVVNELITINVLDKQNDAQYTTGEKAKYLAGSHMTDKNIAISCADCHGESGLLDDAETQVNATCISCHGDLKAVAAITNKTEINPHESHLDKINCTACHGGHEPSAIYCNNCHSFSNQISHVGIKPLPKKLDIAAYDNASSNIVENTDVLVIGAGGSGFISALTAQENGAKVILVEKMPIPGGNSQLAAGGMNAAGTTYQKEQNIQDDAETMFQDTMKGGKNISNPDLVHVLANKIGRAHV